MPIEVVRGAMRPLPPLRQAIVERPIIALPPMPPRNPEMMLPRPIAPTTRPEWCGVLVKPETTSAVISDSMQPTAQSSAPWVRICVALPGRERTLMSY